nr:EOG090X02VY [Triops cancriformis]
MLEKSFHHYRHADCWNLNMETLNSSFSCLCEEEERINNQLESLLARHCVIEGKLRNIAHLVPRLQGLQEDGKRLSSMINFTAVLADNVSAKVRELDTAKGRVSECQQRVNDLLDLKLCREGVVSALRNEDFEQAAAHVHRFLAMDETLLKLTAGDVAEGPNVDSSLVLLHQAQDQLCEVVRQRFNEAIKENDLASAERFFKIFPLLNLQTEGLEKFSLYLASQLKDTSQKNLERILASGHDPARAAVVYADALTLLLENVARTIEINQPLVETYYGPGKIIFVFGILQKECDRQVNHILVEFKRSRGLERRVRQVSDWLTRSDQKFGAQVGGEKLDPRELDNLLAELTLLSARAELYLRFLRRRITGDLEIGVTDDVLRKEKLAEMEVLLQSKVGLSRAVQELMGQYILLEQYFMSETVAKAVELDTLMEDSLISSIVDDVFFIVKKCIRRAIGSSNVDSICAVINNACTLLEEDYANVFHQQLSQGLPSGYLDLTQAYNVLQTSLQQGRLQVQSSDTEKARLIFLTALNNADTSVQYSETLQKSIDSESSAALGPALVGRNKEKLQTCLTGLNSTAVKFRSIVDFGLQQLRASAIKPRVKPWVDAFLSVGHEIDEEELASFEFDNRIFTHAKLSQMATLLNLDKLCLEETNCNTLIGSTSSSSSARAIRANRGISDNQIKKLLTGLIAILTSAKIIDRTSRNTKPVFLTNLGALSCWCESWKTVAGRSKTKQEASPNSRITSSQIHKERKKENVKNMKIKF